MKVTLLVPTLNEFESMTQIMPLVNKKWVDQILIVDGGSKDNTVEWARTQGYDVYIQKAPGLRQAYREALDYVKGDVIITFSPDGNSLPEHIPPLIDKIREGYDMVIVSRYLPPAKSHDDSFITGFGNWFFTKLINLFYAAKYTDTFVMFRAYKKNLLLDLHVLVDEEYKTPEKLFKTRIPIEPLLSIRAARSGCKITEIPGDEPARIAGIRKLEVFRWGAGFLYQILREVFPRKNGYLSHQKKFQ